MLDAKEERKARKLREIARQLHIPLPEAFWTLETFDKDGRLLERHHQRSHSWTRNAYNLMFAQLAAKDLDELVNFGAGHLSLKETGAATRGGDGPSVYANDISIDGITFGFRGPAGNDDFGILVGSGTDAESFEDYVLQTKIAEGAGAGQLNHAQSQGHSISYGALTFKNELVRYLNNNSGGDVNINEVGLFCHGYRPGAGTTNEYCFCRDKLPTTVPVPDTGQCKVTYTVQLTYPA